MKIKELLDHPSKWTQCSNARDVNGNQVLPNDKNAVQWCLFGAIYKCYHSYLQSKLVYNKIKDKLNIVAAAITPWNDSKNRKFEEVKQLVEELDI